jgi:serine/threonine protein kinase
METLKELIPKIKYIKTNIDGSKRSYGNINLLDLYNIAEPKIAEICSKYNIMNFELPKISGYNSLVIYADNKQSKFAIKIFVISKNDIENFDTIYKHVSENLISPKIYYDENIEYNSKKYVVKITVTDRLILFSEFKWESLDKMKNSIMTLIEKTVKLHSLGYVHNDIKYENLGMDADGTIYLFDFDNFSEVCKTSCSKVLSSAVCHPPDILVEASISNGLGNKIIDLFSICAIILGNIIGIDFWAFNNKQLYEKDFQIRSFERNSIHDSIERKIYEKFNDFCLSKFWFSLVNFLEMVFQKNPRIKNNRAFTRRAKKLVARMKSDLM